MNEKKSANKRSDIISQVLLTDDNSLVINVSLPRDVLNFGNCTVNINSPASIDNCSIDHSVNDTRTVRINCNVPINHAS